MSNREKEIRYEVTPLVGWDQIRLGDTKENVRTALQNAGIQFDDEFDPFSWELVEPSCAVGFAAGEPQRVVQIIFGDFGVRVLGAPVLGMPLPAALVNLGVVDFSDTLWSLVDSDVEWRAGVTIDDTERPTQADAETLLDCGTLWIISQGLGIVCYDGRVDSIILRASEHVPRVGCGPLTAEHILLGNDQERAKKRASTLPQPITETAIPKLTPSLSGRTRLILAAVGLLLIATPIGLVIREAQRWSGAISVTGKVVAVQPEMFPDIITFEYPLPDQSAARVEVKFTYTDARKIGDEAELLYVPDNPQHAITRIALNDVIVDTYSPLFLLGSFVAGLMCLKTSLRRF